jgi:choline transport protein
MLISRFCAVAEEVYNASTVVPWAIVATIMVNGVLGLALLIALLFCLGDVTAALTTPTGFPFIEIFAQATNSNAAATAMSCLILFLLTASGSGCMATASRLLWSFARDNGVPFSGYISRVSLCTPQLRLKILKTLKAKLHSVLGPPFNRSTPILDRR